MARDRMEKIKRIPYAALRFAKRSLPPALKRAIKSAIRVVGLLRAPAQPVSDINADLCVSIVVPCYNHGHYVGLCFESLRSQTYPNVEIIVVDDASTDPLTHRALDELDRAPNARIIRNRSNQGIVATSNEGIIQSRGDWIAFVDCDDFLEVDAIEKVVAFIKNNPGCSFVFTDRVLIGPGGEMLQHLRYCGVASWLEEGGDHARNLLRAMVASHLKVVRRDAFLRIGLLRRESEGCQDYDMALRLADQGGLAYLSEAVYNYRWHEKSVTLSKQTRQQATFNRLQRAAFERRTAKAWGNYGNLRRHSSEAKSLLVVIGSYSRDAARVMLDLVEVLSARGWSITVALLRHSEHSSARFELVARTITLPVETWDPSAQVEFLKRLIEDDRINVIHLADAESGQLLARHLWDIVPRPYIVDTIQEGRDESIHQSVFHESLLDARIAVTSAIEGKVRNLGVSSGRCVTIRNGVDLRRLQPNLRSVVDRRKFVFHGRLVGEEQPLRFVEIAALVAQRDPSVRFEVVGDGPLRDAVADLARERGLEHRLALRGWAPIGPILNEARAVIVPPDNAGQPITLCEAMAAGVPVIAAAVGGIPEVVSHGVDGLLVSPANDLAQYAACAWELLDDIGKTEAIGLAARATAERHFCRERMADEVESLYRLSSSRRPFFEGVSGLCSLLLRCRDCSRTLIRTVQSILAHTALPFELVILENALDEATRSVLHALDALQCVRVVSEPDPADDAEQMRLLVELARGDYLVLLDDATEVGPGWLESLIERLERDPRIGAAVCRSVLADNTVEFTAGDSTIEGERVWFSLRHRGLPATSLVTMQGGECNWAPGSMAMYRREVFRHISLDLGDLGPFVDLDVSMQMRATGFKMISCPEATVVHHRPISRSNSPAVLESRHGGPRIDEALLSFHERWGLWIWDPELFQVLGWSIQSETDLLQQLSCPFPAREIGTAA
jgi:glycosyltransferase involved in cell wall biosynthesis/GT2 family glycosyltransferase